MPECREREHYIYIIIITIIIDTIAIIVATNIIISTSLLLSLRSYTIYTQTASSLFNHRQQL